MHRTSVTWISVHSAFLTTRDHASCEQFFFMHGCELFLLLRLNFFSPMDASLIFCWDLRDPMFFSILKAWHKLIRSDARIYVEHKAVVSLGLMASNRSKDTDTVLLRITRILSRIKLLGCDLQKPRCTLRDFMLWVKWFYQNLSYRLHAQIPL